MTTLLANSPTTLCGALGKTLFAIVCLITVAAATTGAFPAAAGAQQAAARADADVALLSRAGDARAIGPDSARVIVIEFLDFACPTCQLFHVQRGDSLRRAIGPDVRLVYVTLLHPNFFRAYHAAEAANCASVAGGQAAYAGMADRLFRNASEWSEASDPGPVFARFARELRVDTVQFEDCRARDLTAPLIVSDMGTASTFDVQGTPTFLMIPRGAQGPEETLRISGNVSIAQITDLISQARAKSR